MESKWIEMPLGEYAEINMGQSPKSEYYNESQEGTPFLQGNKTFGNIYPNFEKYTTKITKLAKKNEVLFSVRAPVGEINIAPEQLCIGRGLASLRSSNNIFLYYLLKFNQNKYEGFSTGTVFSSINKTTLNKIPVNIPDSETQEKISNVLWSLDSKIELNNQIIDTLEEIASTLFKRWFVDFEFPDENGNPYKSSGGKMIDSEFGEIPEGWEIGKLSDYGDVVGGGTPSKKKQEYYDNGTVSWITPKDLSELKVTFIEKGKLSITDEALKKSSAKHVPKGTVLFSSRAPIGYIAIAKNSLTTNQGFKSIVPNDSMSSFFIYLWLKRNLEMIKSLGTGSTFIEVSGGTMKNIDTIIPKSKIVSQFDEIIVPVFKLIEKCESENSSLTDTRDTLLPKLLSGEIEF
ncbi:restriction endonuclease subunit S [Vagococcus fluvialis]|uniref:restriction endonuclease subunit S n=1 Tax=Vagococcus fluvialis TaxID=2738 RepID=UPI0037B31ED4